MTGLSVGSTIAGCRLDAVAGKGGMGVVFRASQLALDRTVAVKAIAPHLAEDGDFRDRFQRESRIAASIDHPNVIPVYEAGELDGTLYLIMRWVDGTDLRTLLAAERRLAPGRAIELLRPVALALAAAHRRGLVHRDVKPANVLIAGGDGGEEHVYLTDFGIARHAEADTSATRTGVLVGTLDYTAPERIEGNKGDAAADIYAFGCMLYEALTGAVPFARPTELAKMHAHLNDPPPSARALVPEVSPELDAIIARAMAKDPAQRQASASELAAELEQAREETDTSPISVTVEAATLPTAAPTLPTTPTLPDASAPPVATGQRRRLVAGIGVLAAAVIAVAAVALSGGGGSHTSPPKAPVTSAGLSLVNPASPAPRSIAPANLTVHAYLRVWKATGTKVTVLDRSGVAVSTPAPSLSSSAVAGAASHGVWFLESSGELERINPRDDHRQFVNGRLQYAGHALRPTLPGRPSGIAAGTDAILIASGDRVTLIGTYGASDGRTLGTASFGSPVGSIVAVDNHAWVTVPAEKRTYELSF